MELAAVVKARAIAYIEPMDLNPLGRVYYPSLTEALVERYGFKIFPQKIEDYNESKGITFATGRLGDENIEQVVIYTYGIVLETRTSTHDSKRLLEEAIAWGVKELGFTNRPVSRWMFTSELTFYSTVPMMGVSSPTQRLAHEVSRFLKAESGDDLQYEQTSLTLDHDQLNRKHPRGRFSIQRRDNTPFSENKYFSDAPLHTDTHWKLLQEFEADVARSNRK